jgi:short-subunit dehydrogenase
MKQLLDKDRFGPWALVTGASSGIGKELTRQLAANGLNVVIAARRIDLLKELGNGIAREFSVQFRAVQVDLSEEGSVDTIKDATRDLDIGLIVSNAGAIKAGEFMTMPLKDLHDQISINVVAHMELVRYFAPRLVKRARGGVMLVGAMGASIGIPYIANPSATKAYILALGEALHFELAKHGVAVTVLTPGLTDTAVLPEIMIDPRALPMKPLSVAQVASEGIAAIQANKSLSVPGALNRFINRVVPASIARTMEAKLLKK